MSFLLLALLAAAPAPAPPDPAAALAVVVSRFETAGRTAPLADAALEGAAQELAKRALSTGVAQADSLLALTDAVSRHGGWEPLPTILLIRTAQADLISALGERADLAAAPASLVGVGVATEGDSAALCILLVRRKVELAPFARVYARPPAKAQPLCARLLPPLTSAQLFVTRPAGDVERLELKKTKEQLCAAVAFPTTGRYTVELLGLGPQGPDVGALFFVDVAVPPGSLAELQLGREPSTPAEARAALVARVNALRVSMGLSQVQPDAALDAVAQRYAERLATEDFFAHIAPDGSDLKQRLATAKYKYSAAGENLGSAAGPLAAHWGIEHSPGHRKNLLEPGYSRLGVGVALRPDGQARVVEVLTAPVLESADDPLTVAYQALTAARAKQRLPPLHRSALLEALAQEHARQALALQLPKAELPGQQRLNERAVELLDDATAISVDILVTHSPARLGELKNAVDPRNTRVGVGVVRGSTQKFGADQYWAVAIYAGGG